MVDGGVGLTLIRLLSRGLGYRLNHCRSPLLLTGIFRMHFAFHVADCLLHLAVRAQLTFRIVEWVWSERRCVVGFESNGAGNFNVRVLEQPPGFFSENAWAYGASLVSWGSFWR